jgi:hypothetical protein
MVVHIHKLREIVQKLGQSVIKARARLGGEEAEETARHRKVGEI